MPINKLVLLCFFVFRIGFCIRYAAPGFFSYVEYTYNFQYLTLRRSFWVQECIRIFLKAPLEPPRAPLGPPQNPL